MKYSTLLFLSLIIPIFYCCPETTTWLVFENIVESATFPAIDYQNDTFCIIPTDANNMEWIYTRPMLANLNATSNLAEWNYYSFRLENSTTCSFTDSTVQGCLSHCADPNLERLLIQSAMASYKTADIIQQISQNISTTMDTVIISAYVSPSDWTQLISYVYFNDTNYCSVFVNIKKPTMFPYGIFTSLQIVS